MIAFLCYQASWLSWFSRYSIMENTSCVYVGIAKWPPLLLGGVLDAVHVIIVIIDHQNIRVDITFSVI